MRPCPRLHRGLGRFTLSGPRPHCLPPFCRAHCWSSRQSGRKADQQHARAEALGQLQRKRRSGTLGGTVDQPSKHAACGAVGGETWQTRPPAHGTMQCSSSAACTAPPAPLHARQCSDEVVRAVSGGGAPPTRWALLPPKLAPQRLNQLPTTVGAVQHRPVLGDQQGHTVCKEVPAATQCAERLQRLSKPRRMVCARRRGCRVASRSSTWSGGRRRGGDGAGRGAMRGCDALRSVGRGVAAGDTGALLRPI